MFLIVAAAILVMLVFSAIKVLNEYQRGVIFTLGRYTGTKGPGLILVVPFIQRMVKVDLRVIVLDVPTQDLDPPAVGAQGVVGRAQVMVRQHSHREVPALLGDAEGALGRLGGQVGAAHREVGARQVGRQSRLPAAVIQGLGDGLGRAELLDDPIERSPRIQRAAQVDA